MLSSNFKGFLCRLAVCVFLIDDKLLAHHFYRTTLIRLGIERKRIRYYLQTDEILQKVLRIVTNEIKKKVIACSPEIAKPEFGAVSIIQRFGNTLNLHPYFHFIVADGVFEKNGESFNFQESFFTQDDIADAQDAIEKSVLKLFKRRGWFGDDKVEKMLSYENTGFFPRYQSANPSLG